MSTMRTVSIRGFGGSIPNRVGASPTFDTTPEFQLGDDDEVLLEGSAEVLISTGDKDWALSIKMRSQRKAYLALQ
jgi:hypothetical protein